MNFCLGLIAHATTSRCVNEVIKANVLPYLGRVMGDAIRRVTRGFAKYASISAKHRLQKCSTSFQTECVTEKSQERREELSRAEQNCAEVSRAEQSRTVQR